MIYKEKWKREMRDRDGAIDEAKARKRKCEKAKIEINRKRNKHSTNPMDSHSSFWAD